MSGPPLVLGYWDFRGFAESCRYLLEYSGCEYEEKRIERPSRSDYTPWRSIREDFQLDFPNLPYLIDGERRLTESIAIMKYLGRKFNLMPKSEEDIIRSDMLEGVVLDLRTSFYDIYFHGDDLYVEYAAKFKDEKFLPKVKNIVKFIGKRQWLVSEKLTYIDFIFYALLSQQLSIFPRILDGLDRLQKYMSDFEAMERIDSYLKSGRCLPAYPKNDPYIRRENIIKNL